MIKKIQIKIQINSRVGHPWQIVKEGIKIIKICEETPTPPVITENFCNIVIFYSNSAWGLATRVLSLYEIYPRLTHENLCFLPSTTLWRGHYNNLGTANLYDFSRIACREVITSSLYVQRTPPQVPTCANESITSSYVCR